MEEKAEKMLSFPSENYRVSLRETQSRGKSTKYENRIPRSLFIHNEYRAESLQYPVS